MNEYEFEGKEIIFGDYETEVIPLRKLIMLSQVRGGRNPISDALTDSIDKRGMLNQVDVVRMSPEDLEEYIQFVNRTWQSEITLDQYADRLMPDGMFRLVAAGHTRTSSVHTLQDRNPDSTYFLKCKIHPISSPEDIVALQLDENIHGKVAEEREAMAIVEAYQWGAERGYWSNKRDFLFSHQANGKITSSKLEKALAFAELPHEMRKFVFAGHIPFLAALELGAGMPDLRRYEAEKLQVDERSTATEDLLAVEEAVRLRINEIIVHISLRSMNSTAARKYVGALRSAWSENDEGDDAVLFTFVSPREQQQEYLAERRRNVRAALREVGELPLWQAEALIDMVEEFSGLDTKEAKRTLEHSVQKARQILGATAFKN